jgi:hypothetical protein
MLYATEVSGDNDLFEINKLNNENFRGNISLKDQENQGFVTWLYSVTLLQKIHALAPSI